MFQRVPPRRLQLLKGLQEGIGRSGNRTGAAAFIVVCGGEFHLLGDYLHARYDEVGKVSSTEGPLRVLVRRSGRTATSSGPDMLPCFG